LKNQPTAKTTGAEDKAETARWQIVHHVRRNFAKARTPGTISALLLAGICAVTSQAGVTRDAGEYNIAVPLNGDQSHPDLALGPNGGYLVWDDNIGDGDGLSVNLRLIDSTLSGAFGVLHLSTKIAGHQERPRAAMLSGGGAAFVWQSGPDGAQQVYTRTIDSGNIFSGDEVAVSVRSELHQITPAVAGLPGGNYVVVWSSFDQDGSMQGVYGAYFDSTAHKIGAEFQINQFTQFNQRNPAVTALPAGGFVVTWISEGNRGDSSVDVYARIFNSGGTAAGNEFRVNTSERVCSSPSIAVTSAGNFTIAWCEINQDQNFQANSGNDAFVISPNHNQDGWDIYAAGFTSAGGRLTEATRINQRIEGNQRNPSIAAVGRTQMVVWDSFGQDGDLNTVVGRTLNGIGAPDGNEQIVNTFKTGRQLWPVVRGDGDSRFLVCWSTFTGLDSLVDLRAQRFAVDEEPLLLPTPAKPYVSALSQSRLSVTWAAPDGYDVANYELYINGNLTPVVVNSQPYVLSGLGAGATAQFEIAYKLKDGQVSPRSPVATGKTWGEDGNFDGLPDDWQAQYWGNNAATWPSPNADSDGDGVSDRQEFMAGTNPKDAASVLRTSFVVLPQGTRLTWNTVPGQIYQVEQTSDFSTWAPYGGLRFAPGTTDSVSVPAGNSLGYYRVNRIR
jgi:hypothetical protein